MQPERSALVLDRVARIVPAVVADDHVGVGREGVDDFALALVAPLGSYDRRHRHLTHPMAGRMCPGRAGARRGPSKIRPARTGAGAGRRRISASPAAAPCRLRTTPAAPPSPRPARRAW